MNIAELFINLGIKGTDKTVGAITDVQKGLVGVKSMAFETKAAIVATMYAIQQMGDASFKNATDLKNFQAETGISDQIAQVFQNAARTAHIGKESVLQSFKSIQEAMTAARFSRGPTPQGLSLFTQTLPEVNWQGPQTLDQWRQHPEELLKLAQVFFQRVKDEGLRNLVAKDLGLGAFVPGLAKGAFTAEALDKALKKGILSDQTLGALDRERLAFDDMGDAIEKSMGGALAKNAPVIHVLVKDFTDLARASIDFGAALAKIGETVGVLGLITKAVKELTGAMKDFSEYQQGKRSFWGEPLDANGNPIPADYFGGVNDPALQTAIPRPIIDFFRSLANPVKSLQKLSDEVMKGSNNYVYPAMQDANGKITPHLENLSNKIKDAIVPAVQKAQPLPGPGASNTTINQNLHFAHEGRDHRRVADSTKDAIKFAYRQLSAQSRAT